MVCQHCQGAEDVFSRRYAQRDLDQYRQQGADGTTDWLITALTQHDIQDMTLLDIGGGVGAIPLALLDAGLRHATDVDASSAYLQVAQEEAQRQNKQAHITYQHGDFIQIAADVDPADIVTLDRVICCYPDMLALVHESSARATQFYGLVYPRDHWLVKLGVLLLNTSFRLQKNPFRTFVHDAKAVDRTVCANGFRRIYQRKGWMWQAVVYQRVTA
jgi:ubiquinone/menaquinone biosynthesis C-methylase UbiE